MKAIRVILSLDAANFRMPTSFLLKETYPLPPFSTVIGMVHAACGFEEYHDMKVSIQGKSDGVYTDAFTEYTFKPGLLVQDRIKETDEMKPREYLGGIYTDSEGRQTGVQKNLGHVEMLSNIKLLIHIVPKDEDFGTVLQGLKYPSRFLSLGRHEDIANIESVEEIELTDDTTFVFADMDLYIGSDCISQNAGKTSYIVHKQYVIENGKRQWIDEYKVSILPKGSVAPGKSESCTLMADGDTLVCLF